MTVVVLVPIYKPQPEPLEIFSLDTSLAALAGREVHFIGPEGLDVGFYAQRYPGTTFLPYDRSHFASIPGYNRLLLDPAFYQRFEVDHDFMLVLQTDAVVIRDDLDHWCAQPFDYVGAPWPVPVELLVSLDQFGGSNGRRIRATVGNGGLSLRRLAKCAGLLEEFPQALDYFRRSGSSEDLYFSLLGQLSADFVLPNEITASRFAMELRPSYYFAINGHKNPMGGHGWWKYEPPFWKSRLPASDLTAALWPQASVAQAVL